MEIIGQTHLSIEISERGAWKKTLSDPARFS